MARPRNPKRDKAREIWLESNRLKPLVEIAKELSCSASQIRKWKSQDKWSDSPNSNVTNEKERYHSMKGNSNAEGNKGNKQASPPKNNKNAVTHGLHAKWFPEDTNDIYSELLNSEPADILWSNIMIQYTAIIRAQKIMFVTDKDEMIKELKKEKSSYSDTGSSNETEWEFQFSWERHATFLNAQSRAMTTLSGLIKQFVAIADEKDERRLKLELMQGQINKLTGPQNKSSTDWKESLKDAEEGKFGEIENV